MLHCSENPEAEGKDKIEPFINMFLSKFHEAFYPKENLSLDEMVVGWTGRWKYKMYNPNKPHKYHVKVFGLVDSETGYVLNLLVYFGSETSYSVSLHQENSQAVKVFEYLLRPFGSGHHIYSDRYYTSARLVEYLSSINTYFTGTLNTQRKGFPKELKAIKLPHMGTAWFYHPVEQMICVAFKDKKAKKPCIVVSTNSTVASEQRLTSRKNLTNKPVPVHEYNTHMNGCDIADQNAGYYNFFDRKTYKWYKKLFFWMIELVQINSLVLFKQSTGIRKCSFLSYKKSLVQELKMLAMSLATPEELGHNKRQQNLQNSVVERFTGNLHLVSYSEKDRNCVVCSTPAERRRTKFFSKGCSHKPYLHPKDCFERYHSLTI